MSELSEYYTPPGSPNEKELDKTPPRTFPKKKKRQHLIHVKPSYSYRLFYPLFVPNIYNSNSNIIVISSKVFEIFLFRVGHQRLCRLI